MTLTNTSTICCGQFSFAFTFMASSNVVRPRNFMCGQYVKSGIWLDLLSFVVLSGALVDFF